MQKRRGSGGGEVGGDKARGGDWRGRPWRWQSCHERREASGA
jgi:hypothetical protein